MREYRYNRYPATYGMLAIRMWQPKWRTNYFIVQRRSDRKVYIYSGAMCYNEPAFGPLKLREAFLVLELLS